MRGWSGWGKEDRGGRVGEGDGAEGTGWFGAVVAGWWRHGNARFGDVKQGKTNVRGMSEGFLARGYIRESRF